jgi:VanZ family protein
MYRPSPIRLIQLLFWFSATAIFVLSVLPGDRLPLMSASVWDKAQHGLAFALLTLLALVGWPGRPAVPKLVGLLAFGVAIEVTQATLGWRHGDVADVVADAVGLAIGWVVVQLGRSLT